MGESATEPFPREPGDEERNGEEGPVVEGEPGFDFDQNGLRIVDEDSSIASAGSPLKAAFTVVNTGTAPGSAHVTIEIDGVDSGVSWDSPELQPLQHATPDGDGHVHDLPAQEEGDHEFVAIADPAGPAGGRSPATVTVGPPD